MRTMSETGNTPDVDAPSKKVVEKSKSISDISSKLEDAERRMLTNIKEAVSVIQKYLKKHQETSKHEPTWNQAYSTLYSAITESCNGMDEIMEALG